jgi:hypothetical protein
MAGFVIFGEEISFFFLPWARTRIDFASFGSRLHIVTGFRPGLFNCWISLSGNCIRIRLVYFMATTWFARIVYFMATIRQPYPIMNGAMLISITMSCRITAVVKDKKRTNMTLVSSRVRLSTTLVIRCAFYFEQMLPDPKPHRPSLTVSICNQPNS